MKRNSTSGLVIEMAGQDEEETGGNWTSRKTLTRLFFLLMALLAMLAVVVVGGGGAVAVISSPLWIPILLCTVPCWCPVACCTFPVWSSAGLIGALMATMAAGGTGFAGFVLLFFLWPSEWLPHGIDQVNWLKEKRDVATAFLLDLPKAIGL